jgi:hypothetical protein
MIFVPLCPGDPCDPCGCFAQRADYANFPGDPLLEIDFNLGTQMLCWTPFIWPFVKHSVPDPDRAGYYPIGVKLRGANSVGGSFQPSVESVRLSYLGSQIFACTVTHEFIGNDGAGGWLYQNITGSPAPVQPFQMRYADALSIANQAQMTIEQFFGEYTQDPNAPTGPIGLTGFVYTGALNNQQDKILQATMQNVTGPPGYGFWLRGILYYGPAPVPRIRSQLGHRLPLVARFQGY